MEPQADLPPLPQEELSKVVTTRAKRTVPYPLLGENTLVRSHAHDRVALRANSERIKSLFVSSRA